MYRVYRISNEVYRGKTYQNEYRKFGRLSFWAFRRSSVLASTNWVASTVHPKCRWPIPQVRPNNSTVNETDSVSKLETEISEFSSIYQSLLLLFGSETVCFEFIFNFFRVFFDVIGECLGEFVDCLHTNCECKWSKCIGFRFITVSIVKLPSQSSSLNPDTKLAQMIANIAKQWM